MSMGCLGSKPDDRDVMYECDDYINVRQFGADGSLPIDEACRFVARDDSEAIERAVSFACKDRRTFYANPRGLYFPPGIYILTKAVVSRISVNDYLPPGVYILLRGQFRNYYDGMIFDPHVVYFRFAAEGKE